MNRDNYSDLYWGIRGGGGNFGVVTEFVFELYAQVTTVFAGFLVFPPSALDNITRALKVWWPTAKEDSAMCQILTIGPDGKVGHYPYLWLVSVDPVLASHCTGPFLQWLGG